MSRLDIDFGARWPLLPAGRAVLALCALAAATVSVRYYLEYQASAERLALTWEASTLARTGPDTAGDPGAGADGEASPRLLAALAAASSLDAPWPALFARIEEVPLDAVALLQLDADAAAASLAIEAEARDPDAMREYVDALGESGYLTRVHLVAQQGAAPGPRFSVHAAWPGRSQHEARAQ